MPAAGIRGPRAGGALALALIAVAAGGCRPTQEPTPMDPTDESNRRAAPGAGAAGSDEAPETTQTATFAAGCFWGVEATFRKVPGVVDTAVGYAGGHTDSPTYEQVCSKTTGHAEVVQVEFDPATITYDGLLEVFWRCHDPTQLNRQGPDSGTQYRSAVFYTDDEQKRITESLIGKLKEKGLKVVTQLAPATIFWPAEDYHQDYLERTGRPSCHVRNKRF